MLELVDNVRLEPHPTARSQAVATAFFPAGTKIVSVEALAAVLLPSEKGHRCDACFCQGKSLKKCSTCASYWYCDAECQSMQWQDCHKKMCRIFNTYVSSVAFDALPAHAKMDALLLSHLLARIATGAEPPPESSPSAIFHSLLPGPSTEVDILPLPSFKQPIAAETAKNTYARFGNNNFIIHSHLNSIGHGVFPLASRLFNHSCAPNAAARYIFSYAEPVTMEVVALRDIHPHEEICLPYLDPALLESKSQIFQLTYGFKCTCPSCSRLERLGDIPPPPNTPEDRKLVAASLCEFVAVEERLNSRLQSGPQGAIPDSLRCIFHEAYLQDLSEAFSKASHEGEYDLALESGIILLALYILLYPVNYPQIGMHLLELAKTSWNQLVSTKPLQLEIEVTFRKQTRKFLTRAQEVLSVYGTEGDKKGPLAEIDVLHSLLNSLVVAR